MSGARQYTSPLRQRQLEDTRVQMIGAALQMITEKPDEPVSHEEIAKQIGVGLRTVYRYFPSRSDLLDAVWKESTQRLQLAEFPDTEEKLLEAVVPVFDRMDENEGLIRGLLRSNAGQALRSGDNDRRRAAIENALAQATGHLPEAERTQVVGVFQTLFSARAWEIMRDRAGMGKGEPAHAVLWAMKSLLNELYRQQKQAGEKPSARRDKPGK